MHKLAELFEKSDSMQRYARGYCARLAEVLDQVDVEAIARTADVLDTAAREARTIYLIANGGSAAVASHMVNDLVVGSFVEGQPPFRVFCLTDNAASVTALSNDAAFDEIFVHQLRVHLAAGDVVLAMSASGNSENILRGVAYARSVKAMTIGWCGFDGGRLAQACDIVVHVPATPDEYGPVEDAFGVLSHMISGYLSMKRGKTLHH